MRCTGAAPGFQGSLTLRPQLLWLHQHQNPAQFPPQHTFPFLFLSPWTSDSLWCLGNITLHCADLHSWWAQPPGGSLVHPAAPRTSRYSASPSPGEPAGRPLAAPPACIFICSLRWYQISCPGSRLLESSPPIRESPRPLASPKPGILEVWVRQKQMTPGQGPLGYSAAIPTQWRVEWRQDNRMLEWLHIGEREW